MKCIEGGTTVCPDCGAQGCCFIDRELQRVREQFERIDQKLKEQGTPGRFPESAERAQRPEFNW